MKKVLVILAICLFLLQGIIAPHTEESSVEDSETSLGEVVSINLESGGNVVEWEVDGYSANGFKVVWSRNSSPTYPLRNGDKYHYYSNPETNRDVLDAFDGEGIYYVRVCEYLGGACGVYSNEVEVYLDDDENEVKEKEQTEEKEMDENEEQEKTKEEYSYGEKEDAGEIDFCNQGCFFEQACYPIGYRMSGQYCSGNLEFVNQTEDGFACDNNFECRTNLCISDECIDEGIIRKVLNWLKRFFGGDD